MLISINWLKKYVNINLSTDKLVDLIGSRLVEVEEAVDLGERYKKIYIVRVETCEAIPGTHLHLCSINAGNQEISKIDDQKSDAIQVVCGAPNVRAGMLAVWIAPGAIVPQSVHEDTVFKIGKRKMLKKYESYGMLAGADELDLGDDHSGIVEIKPDTAEPGTLLADHFDLNDIILNIENKSLTHRPDTFGIIGFAREVAGILGQTFGTPEEISSAITQETKYHTSDLLKITTDTELCPRYSAIILDKQGEFHDAKYMTMQKTLLARSGIRPIDPIVDATNYYMLLTGQPLHAFDYDKFIAVGKSKTPHIIIRTAKDREKLTLLDDTTIRMSTDDIVITSNGVPVALAGAMGGANTAIDKNTKRVILESATFNLFNLRRTQMKHGIFSDAIQRFTKGQPASQTLINATICARSLTPVLEPAEVADCYPEPIKPIIIKITAEQINSRLGTEFSNDEIIKTLQNVGFECKLKSNLEIVIDVPLWRTDIHVPVDITEEIGRLHGYDNIKPVLPLHATAQTNPLIVSQSFLRHLLAIAGANELLTYSFIPETLMQKVGQDPRKSFKIVNSISPDLQYIRQTIVPSLLQKAYMNLKSGYGKFILFEINQVFSKSFAVDKDNIPLPEHHVALVSVAKKSDTQYYQLKLYLDHITKAFGEELEYKPFTPTKDHRDAYYEPKRSAIVLFNDHPLGVIGELKASVARALKLPLGTAAAEIRLDGYMVNYKENYMPQFCFGDYPKVERDITLTPKDTKTTYADIHAQVEKILKKHQLIHYIMPLSIYQAEGKLTPNITFRLIFTHPQKTLTSSEISVIMGEIEQIS